MSSALLMVAAAAVSALPTGPFAVKGAFSGPKPADRVMVDIPFRHDLSEARGVRFELTVDAPEECSSFVCHFHSGDGWYSVGVDPAAGGERAVVRVSKHAVGVEGSPAGWRNVDKMRVSGWRGGTNDVRMVVENIAIEAVPPEVVVVQAISCLDRNPNERASCTQFAARMFESLAEIGVDARIVSDSDLDDKALERAKVVMLPYNPALPEPAMKAILDFSARGGKVFAAYVCPAKIRELLGVVNAAWTRIPSAGDGDAGFVRVGSALKWQPAFVPQNSTMTMQGQLTGDAEVVANWGSEKSPTSLAAIVRNRNGVYMGHVWRGGPQNRSLALIASIIRHLLPECERQIVAGRQLAKRRRLAMLDEIAKMPAGPANEFRAFWCHNPRGLEDGRGWEKSVGLLKDGGFNTLIANMAWGGATAYASKFLPRRTDIPVDDDLLEECRVACRKHGVKLHVWKVCWGLGWKAPEDFVSEMRQAGRTQLTFDGKTLDWLCPSHPLNQRLEADVLVEIAKKGVDGVHLDYIRYRDGNGCFCDGCRARFEEFAGGKVTDWPKAVRSDAALVAKWRQFRCDSITALVREVSRRVRAEAPGVAVSAAVFSDFATIPAGIAQDWASWSREGLLDFVCPMDYTSSQVAFDSHVRRQLALGGKAAVYPGIGLFCGPKTSSSLALFFARQIGACRAAGCSGFTVFDFNRSAIDVLPLVAPVLGR